MIHSYLLFLADALMFTILTDKYYCLSMLFFFGITADAALMIQDIIACTALRAVNHPVTHTQNFRISVLLRILLRFTFYSCIILTRNKESGFRKNCSLRSDAVRWQTFCISTMENALGSHIAAK